MKKRPPTGKCAICGHLRQLEIELALAAGTHQHAVARKFSTPEHPISKHSVHRHWKNHVSEERRAQLLVGPVQRAYLQSIVAEEAGSVVDLLRATRSGLLQMYTKALEMGDLFASATLSGRIHENLRIAARLSGELSQSPLVAVSINQQNNTLQLLTNAKFVEFQSTLTKILAKHPQALGEVLTEFERLERMELEQPSTPAGLIENKQPQTLDAEVAVNG